MCTMGCEHLQEGKQVMDFPEQSGQGNEKENLSS